MNDALRQEQHQICDGVKALRRQMGLSVHEFARAVGVTDRTVQYWERHAHPPTGRRLARLRRLYEVWRDERKPQRPTRPSGTIQVKLKFSGKAKPLPVDEGWY